MTITAIGFANKFYTLWNITEETRPLGNGRNYLITHYTYIKNISFDKETALAKYPNAIFDENLRGKTQSWNTKKEVWDNVDTFRFGKYNGMKIDNISDNGYLEWYWDQVYEDHKIYVGEVLNSRGYEIRYNIFELSDGQKVAHQYLMSPEAIENEKRINKEIDKIEEKCKNNEVLEFVPTSNLNEYGEYATEAAVIKFNEYKEMYYNGYRYYLPIDKNGKAKRFKNKNVKITKYTFVRNEYNISITVEDFEIVK